MLNRGFLVDLVEGTPSLNNRFDNPQRLGANGGNGYFSIMFSATDRQTREIVVLKFFNPEHRDSYRLASFQREPELLGTFRGRPGILQLICGLEEVRLPYSYTIAGITKHDVANVHFYVVEKAKADLEAELESDNWSVADKLNAFRSICKSVQRIHAAGICHRDLKLTNFLVKDDRTIQLSDFGTARKLTDTSLAAYHFPVGDLAYSAPEQHAGLHDATPDISLRSDFYSLGAIFFELFTATRIHYLLDNGLFVQCRHIATQPSKHRMAAYHSIIGSLASSCPVPMITHFTDQIPACVADLMNALGQGLAAVDYRRRLVEFAPVFSRLDRITLILKNETEYKKWRDRQRAIRDVQIAKEQSRSVQGMRP